MLKGYAGTGKTTLVSTLVKSLPAIGKRSVLMAPTGRAAKVLSKYSKNLQVPYTEKFTGLEQIKVEILFIKLKENLHSNTIFIVDEASMISESSDSGFGNRSLLQDLIKYVYEGIDCKLILIGDKAQLPPVNLDISPALNEEILYLTTTNRSFQKNLPKL